jgi:hypothetical protein
MTLGEILLPIYILGIPLLAIVPLIIKLRGRKRFSYFRVTDARTKAPVAGEVFVVGASHSQPYVMGGVAAPGGNLYVQSGLPSQETFKKVGELDAQGCFRGTFGSGVGAFTVRGPGITSGLIGIESVSDYRAFPPEPYECVLRMGMIAPPEKHSAMSLGLGPGESVEKGSGYMESYETPVKGDEGICWPTLEEAKSNSLSGGMSRLWRVQGTKIGPGVGGNSFMVAVETSKRAEGSSKPR